MKIYVIGGSNIDIQGASQGPLVARDSNIGTITYSFGGVGRNIAENLALLKDDVALVSALGNDIFGEDMYRYCASAGIDMSRCVRPNGTSSIYLAILDENRDMRLAVNDMKILKAVNELLAGVLAAADPEDLIVLDANLEPAAIRYICAQAKGRLIADPISAAKAGRLKPYLGCLDFFKPNRLEAEELSGIPMKDSGSYRDVLEYFIRAGVRQIAVSLGKDGVIAAAGSERFWIRHSYVKMVNATGAGDSFTAGAIHRLSRGAGLEAAVRFAVGCAMMTVRSTFTVSESLSEEAVNELLKNLEMERQEL